MQSEIPDKRNSSDTLKDDGISWKDAEYGKPKTTIGLVGLFWKEFEYEDKKGKTIKHQDYIFSEDYKPEYTYGMITRDEILVVLQRLKKCPEYVLYPKKFKMMEQSSKVLILLSFLIFIASWVMLTVVKSKAKILIFCVMSFIFVFIFCIACCRFSSSRSKFKRYLAYRDIYFDEVLKDCNKMFSSRGVKFYYNNFSKYRDIVIRIRRPGFMKKQEGEIFERHYLGFESIIKHSEEKARKLGKDKVTGPDLYINQKNVFGNFVVDEEKRGELVKEEMKLNDNSTSFGQQRFVLKKMESGVLRDRAKDLREMSENIAPLGENVLKSKNMEDGKSESRRSNIVEADKENYPNENLDTERHLMDDSAL